MTNIDLNRLVVLDIETVGKTATYQDLKNNDPRLAELWEKRSAWLKERYSDNNGPLSVDELWEQKSGLHAEYGKVICVTFGIFNGEENVLQSFYGDDETDILKKTRTVLSNSDAKGLSIAGHTIERFDVPFLWKRMLANKMKPPHIITTWDKKPWDMKFFDVAKFWGGGAWQEGFTSLDTMSAIFGVESPKAEMQASRVHGVYYANSGNIESIKRYCEGDVVATMDLIREFSKLQ